MSEFQLDIEMSFVNKNSIISLVEDMLQYSWAAELPPITTPFPHMTYDQAMRLYGSDKPDTRFDMKVSFDSIIAQIYFDVL